MRQGEFNDPRLVKVYDAECLWGRDDDFFLSVINETPAAQVLDLGCGTGRLTIGIAAAGHTVTGVDPAKASIDEARSKPGAEDVAWIEGTSTLLPDAAFDVAVMTTHVAQFFIDDDDFTNTLADLKRALVPGGRLVFDTRDPQDRPWEHWNPVDSRHQVMLEGDIEVDIWTEGTAVHDDVVDFTHRYVWPTGEPGHFHAQGHGLVSVLAISDLLYSAQIIYANNYQTIPLLIVASLWYLLMTTILSFFQTKLERRYGRGFDAPPRRTRRPKTRTA